MTDGPDTGSLDYEWTNIKDNGRDIIFRGGRKKRKKKKRHVKKRNKRTRKKKGSGGVFSRPLRVRPFVPEEQGENNTVDTFVSESDNQDDGENLPVPIQFI